MSVAVLSSFSHCYAMCGGFNLAFLRLNLNTNGGQNALNGGANDTKALLNAPARAKNSVHFTLILTYHAFRISAYVLLGVIFGAFGNVLGFFNKGIFFFVLGVFMVLLGVALIFRGQFLALIENPFLFNLWVKKVWQKVHFKGYKSAVVLGFCNGFVPCGLVYFALALAMSQKSVCQSALIMLIFGLCTLPALLFFSEFARLLAQRYQKLWIKLTAFIIMLYGLYLAYLGVVLTR